MSWDDSKKFFSSYYSQQYGSSFIRLAEGLPVANQFFEHIIINRNPCFQIAIKGSYLLLKVTWMIFLLLLNHDTVLKTSKRSSKNDLLFTDVRQ
ncbi:hypothetical protein CYK00_08055 [Neisseria sicca]|uniref:Uncharacterized protein n=1 Tax=Neisseria sicca TaxID=490 RepID=A0A2I1XBJ6_NEISI|nr:hypothetical protein CYK00_08055 [Neisseria sicca]